MGGSVGLKGSDGAAIQQQAIRLGGVSRALERAAVAMELLRPLADRITILTYPGEMGADAVYGFDVEVIGKIAAGDTTPEDTRHAAAEMMRRDAALILFAGGDGTARDLQGVIGTSVPALGIPAGVKIHSSVYAVTPRAAGALTARFLEDPSPRLSEGEVMDIDEDALRKGIVSARLYGTLKVPQAAGFVQNPKSSSPASDRAELEEIADAIAGQMEPDTVYIIGPGTTMRAIASRLRLEKTLVGVDVVLNGKLIAADANEERLLSILDARPHAKIIVTPIGGQGYLFGRGNQQISPAVIRRVGRSNLIVAGTVDKLVALGGRPLLVDTGDEETDLLLSGYVRVATGHGRSTIYRVSGGAEFTSPSEPHQGHPE